MYRLPAESTARPVGITQLGAGGRAVVAAEAHVPFPATVVITPFETLRMRLLPYRRCTGCRRSPRRRRREDQLGAGGRAVVAAEAGVPFPATVVITPFETLRMRFPSAM